MDFNDKLRSQMLKTIQFSLRQMRLLLNIGVQDFADFMGVTRQTLNNLETQKIELNPMHYICISAIIEYSVKKQPETLKLIQTIISSYEINPENGIFKDLDKCSLMDKWFMTFPEDHDGLDLYMQSNNSNFIGNINFVNFITEYKIFLDDTILLIDNIETYLSPFATLLKENNTKFFIPLNAIQDIMNMSLDLDEDKRNKAHKAINILTDLQNNGLIDIRGDKSDINIISTLVSVFAKFKFSNKLALFTCNDDLAKHIDNLNSDEFGGNKIIIITCSTEGGFKEWGKENKNENIELVIDEQIQEEENNQSFNKLNGWDELI